MHNACTINRVKLFKSEDKSLLGVNLKYDDARERRVKIFKCIDFLETYLRDLILSKLKENYGEKWTEKVPQEVIARWKALGQFENPQQPYYPELRNYYPDLRDYMLIIEKNWSIFSDVFRDLNKTDVIETLKRLKRKRNLSYHASPKISERDVEETEFLVKRLLISDYEKKKLEEVLRGEKLTKTEVRIMGPLIFQLNGVSSAEELAKLTDLPVYIVKMILREAFLRAGLVGMTTGAEIRYGAIAGAPTLGRTLVYKHDEEIFFVTMPKEEVLRKYPEILSYGKQNEY